jgi:threonine dehydrogenase-like Zn-dependent dehydrogenase
MQALFYQVNPVGWATCKWLRYLWSGCLLSKLNGISLREVEIPKLPGRDWVRVRTILGGICGSDVRILGQGQPANSILQAFSSMPMILGHENVGLVVKVGPDVDASWKRRRVCVEPTLCCEVRGIDPPCQRCREGQFGMCENFAASGKGNADLPPGTSIGYNSRTGGSFGEYFVAHQSQLVPVPDELSDEQAALTDPVACSLHAVLRVDLSKVQRVLVYGTGVLGLGVIAALRAVGYEGQIDALDRYESLERVAAAMGANAFLRLPASRKERFEMVAERTGASLQRARFGNYMLSGGYDVVFDCVGSPDSINETLKWTRARGQVALIGTGHGGRVDLTPIWFREVTVIGAYGRQFERHNGRRIETYKLVYELMLAGKLQLADLLTHRFPLREYRKAIDVGMHKAKHAAIKVAFDFRNKG